MSKGKVLIIVGDATKTVDTLRAFHRVFAEALEPVLVWGAELAKSH